MRCTVDYYRNARGDCPAKMFIESLPAKLRAKNVHELELLEEFGTSLPAPYTKQLRGAGYDGLWELRVKLASNITRVFYFFPTGNRVLLLHGFIKKTDKTPVTELNTAKRRMDDAMIRGVIK